ncbi:MAG: NUDIX hydrolase [Ndongobacter sp.]|nr:NUDIX hydrolase [Ndongobacter sp.]
MNTPVSPQSENILKSETLYEGRIITLRIETVELPDMKYAKREIVDHMRGVGIIAVSERNTMYLVRQYRVAVRSSMLEIPAGLVEAGEAPADAAARELREEIGLRPEHLEYLLDAYASPGFTNEKISLFVATGLVPDPLPADETEFIEIVEYPIDELYQMVLNFEITDAKTIIAIQYAYRRFVEGRS